MTTLAHAAWQRGNDVEAARWLGEDVDLLTTPTWPMDLDYVVLAARVAHTSSDFVNAGGWLGRGLAR